MARRTQPLADLVGASLGRAMARQGFSAADIVLSWPEIVGERLAAFSQPIRLDWSRRVVGDASAASAALVVRVESAFAIELQHLAPLVLERVNAHYGWRCAGRLVLKQGPVRRAKPAASEARSLTPVERTHIDLSLDGIEEVDLKGALDRLATAVVTAERALPDDPDGTTVPQS